MKNLYKDGVKSVSEEFAKRNNSKTVKRNTYGSVDYKKKLATTRATGRNAYGNKPSTYPDGTSGVGFGKASGIMGGLGMLGTMAGIATGNEELGKVGATVNNLGGIASGIGAGYENRNRVYKMGTKGVKKKKGRC